MLALMASFLDPRMKGGVGILEEDQNKIYKNIWQHMIDIANEKIAQVDEVNFKHSLFHYCTTSIVRFEIDTVNSFLLVIKT
jgi:hypothetical protein